jgi:hypothetical protein
MGFNSAFKVLIHSQTMDINLNSVMFGSTQGNVPAAQGNIHCVKS